MRSEFLRLHFIADKELARFVEQHTAKDIDLRHELFTNSSWAWIVQTSILLREAGLTISISNEYESDAINLGLATKIRQMPRTLDYFVVSIDADQLRPRWANLSLVQNQSQTGGIAFWVPHWPQPGLIPRSTERNSLVHAGFFGVKQHLYKDEQWWKEACAKHDIKFSVRQSNQWHDYSDIDIAIGVRKMTRKKFHEKPPTKLFNAWLAQVIFIGGVDSAYTQTGDPDHNYLMVENEKALDNSFKRLRQNPSLGKSLIEAGRQRVTTLGSRHSTLQAWLNLIENKINPIYQNWHRQSTITKNLVFYTGIVSDLTIRGRNEAWRKAKIIVKKI